MCVCARVCEFLTLAASKSEPNPAFKGSHRLMWGSWRIILPSCVWSLSFKHSVVFRRLLSIASGPLEEEARLSHKN